MQDMNYRHKYDNSMQDIPIYDGKNMDLGDWSLQTEKVALPTSSQEHELGMAKSTGTLYKKLKQMGGARSWPEITKKLEEVCPSIATAVHAASDLHRTQ